MRISDWSSDVCSSDLSSLDTRKLCHRNAHSFFQYQLGYHGTNRARGMQLQDLGRRAVARVKAGNNDFCVTKYPRRTAERRVGRVCVITGKTRWAPYI